MLSSACSVASLSRSPGHQLSGCHCFHNYFLTDYLLGWGRPSTCFTGHAMLQYTPSPSPRREQEIGYSQQSTLWAPRHRCALLPRALPPRVVQAVRQRVLRSARKEKADSTRRSSRAVPHPSTNRALRRLTSEVRRDPVHSTRYGRQQKL